ncbi:MAG: gliding motility-associated-like protein [Bacteroidia bacterium]|jgi:gliding motility-associated-like protein
MLTLFNVIYKPIVVDETKGGTFRTAFIYQDATDYGMNISTTDDSLCTINDEFFHIIGSDIDNTVQFNIVTDQPDEWTKMADFRRSKWNKVSLSGETRVDNKSAYEAQSYEANSDFAIALATERPFVETVEKTLYVPFNTSVKLEPKYYALGNSTILWTPPDYLDCDNCPTPWYSAGMPETYTIEVDNGYGCLASDTIRIEVIRGENNPTLIPNAFSPNGDLLNDVFRPYLYPFEILIRLRVYNRWGGLVYDGQDGWDGTYMGRASPMGAYVYLVEIQELKEGGRYQKNWLKGTINLLK